EQDRQFVIKNLNDLLAGRNAAQDRFTERVLFNTRDEIFGDLEIDVSIEQREANLPQRGVDVGLADFSVAAKILENLLQLIAQLRKQIISSVSPSVRSRPARSILRSRRSSGFRLSYRRTSRSRSPCSSCREVFVSLDMKRRPSSDRRSRARVQDR